MSQRPHDHHVDHEEHEHGERTIPMAHVHEEPAVDETAHNKHTDHTGHEEMFRRRFWVSLALSIPVLYFSPFIQDVFGYAAFEFPGSTLVTPALAIVVFAYGGVPFLRMAQTEIATREPGMMLLISLAITVAFVYSLASLFLPGTSSFFWELVTLIDVMLLGHWMEMRSVRQASGALDELAKLMPDTAERITDDGSTQEVPVSSLTEDDVVLVRPGASIPADGEVVEGETSTDESMVTGESRPVDKAPGDDVIGGTVNSGDGSLRVRVTATGDETALAGIMRLVADAQRSKSRTQLLADRAAGWLFYTALGVATLTAIAWTVAVGFDLDVVERVVTVLVIACPHALGLAVPLVVSINTSTAARNGILIRDRIAMEEARDLDTIVFDKTGTLTRGEHGVVDIVTVEDWTRDQVLALAAAVESDSEHFVARAVRERAAEVGIDSPAASGFEALKGRGVRAEVEGQNVYVGGPNLLRSFDFEPSGVVAEFADDTGSRGQSVVYVVVDEEIVGAIALADVVREESRRAVEALHEMDLEVAMLTGDSEDVARAVAADLGIDVYFAEVLPEDKDEKISELQEEGKTVAMVGDGVNDAPALARADVGIAIGSGTDVAIESGGIILVENNPLDIVRLIRLSRASYRKMQENLVWATGYNVIALPLAAGILAPVGILLSPAIGAVFMSLSTIVVAINARRLRRIDLSITE